MADVYVALLRGINVGGKNKLPMKELAALFDNAGCSDVRTYIQSGNVIFSAAKSLAIRVPGLIARAILDRYGIRVPVVTRTSDELRDVARNNPFLNRGADEGKLHVAFIADRPDAEKVGALDPSRSRPDEFAVHGHEVYLHCPNGFARTRLTNDYFDRTLATTCTIRNWRTVLKLLEMCVG